MTQSQLPFWVAPNGLREKIEHDVRAAAKAEGSRRRAWRKPRVLAANGMALAACLCLVALSAWSVGASYQARDDQRRAILDSHLRSLAPGHLTDVTSTDQHTVKPWFAGKIDFSPPVVDHAPDGFPLVGGRVDVVGGHTVAALVYSRANHLINVFVQPASGSELLPASAYTSRGYHVVSWSRDEMQFRAVSDLNLRELLQLRDLLQQP